jgi:hypothetical protein
MNDKEFLKQCGLTQEYGVRRRTPIGTVDMWYGDDKEAAWELLTEEDLDRGDRSITRWVSEEMIFDDGRWQWSRDWIDGNYRKLGLV